MAGFIEPDPYSANQTPFSNTILNVLINRENNGMSKSTIWSTNKILTHISKHANLNEPEQIKRFIAKHQCTNGYKKNMCIAYNRYCKYYKIVWEMPLYKQEQRRIKIPTKEKLVMLIAHSGRKMALKLEISMETGLRPIELVNLKVKDIDLDRKVIYPTTAKNGLARTLKISSTLQNMLSAYITKEELNPNDKLFNITRKGYSKLYRMTRDKLAKKLQDPSLRTIRLYDFRHYYATMLYHKTRDILYVKQQMGHKRIDSTLIYTQLLSLEEDEWTCKHPTQ